jgi:hypothetical protein
MWNRRVLACVHIISVHKRTAKLKTEHEEEQTGSMRIWFPLYFQHIPQNVILAVNVQIPQ